MIVQASRISSDSSSPEYTSELFGFISHDEWRMLGAWLIGSVVLAIVLWFVISHVSRTHTRTTESTRKRRALRTASVGVSLLSGLSLLFYGIWTTIGDHIPASFQTSIPFIILIILATWLAQRFSREIITYLVERYGKPGDHSRSAALSTSALEGVVRAGVIVIGLLSILSLAGVPISPLFAAVGAIGVGLALGAQSLIERWIAGIQIAFAEHIMPGQYIEVDGHQGYVEDVKALHTVLRTLGGNRVVFPNEVMVGAVIKNRSLKDTVTTTFVSASVAYDSDLERVEEIALDVAHTVMRALDGGASDADPFVRFTAFGDSSIQFKTALKAKTFVDQYELRHEFFKALKRRFHEEGIDIPFPIRDVRVTPSPIDPINTGISTKDDC